MTNEHKRLIGKIFVVKEDKGFGFITCSEIPFERIFFHWSALVHDTKRFKELTKGMKVEFTPAEYFDKETNVNQGFRALRIKVIESEDDINRKVS